MSAHYFALLCAASCFEPLSLKMEEKKMRNIFIIIDLDGVLINTERIKCDLFEIARRHSIPLARARDAYAVLRKNGHFSLENYARALLPRKAEAQKMKKEFEALFREPQRYNFAGVEEFLAGLKGYHLVLLTAFLSREDRARQQRKIRQSGLRHFFDEVVLTADLAKRDALQHFCRHARAPLVVVVDDKQEIVEYARSLGMGAIRVFEGRKDASYYRRLCERVGRCVLDVA